MFVNCILKTRFQITQDANSGTGNATYEQCMKKDYLKTKLFRCPPGTGKKGTLRNTWMQEVTTEMREKGISNMEWNGRKEGKRKTKLQAQKNAKTLIFLFKHLKHFK